MDGILVVLVLAFLLGPITIAIIALANVSHLRNELHRLRGEVQRMLRDEPTKASGRTDVEPAPLPAEEPVSLPPKVVCEPESIAVVSAVPPPRVPSAAPAKKPGGGVEFMMGGKAAAFAGIAVLVMGIVFLVGYAIQRSWIGPETRIVLGLLSGGALVGFGHWLGRKDPKLRLFAQVLTGGGSALFYFSVFAAYGIYDLIGPVMAGLGLFASALAVFGLAMAYRSQAVGVLGVLGAFVTPLLIGGDIDEGVFPLVYVAVVNVPVFLLGIRRKWQVLYNLAFAFTILHFLVWLDWIGSREVWVGLGFAVLYFTQYAALGLLKLRSEQKVAGRTVDLVRLVLSSMLLLGAVYWLLDESNHNHWVGTAFLLLALYHVALARFAFRLLARFGAEILCFLSGGLLFATLALPAQLDGEWVSLGWAIEGVVLAWFAGRVGSRALQAGAFLLGLIGIMKALLFDVSLYASAPRLFLNARFAVGMLSAVLLGVQGWLAGRFPAKEQTFWQDALWCTGIVGVVLVFFADTFWTLGFEEISSWVITSLMLLATGAAAMMLVPQGSAARKLGVGLVLLVPLKLMLDALVGSGVCDITGPVFSNSAIWLELAMVAAMILFLQPRLPGIGKQPDGTLRLARMLNIMALAAAIWLMTWEFLRSRSDWASTAISILWAVWALALILFGMKRRVAAHRYFGLVLFGITTLKVLVYDSSELHGLERIAAFIGTGILLLALSFAYQKASAFFQTRGEGE